MIGLAERHYLTVKFTTIPFTTSLPSDKESFLWPLCSGQSWRPERTTGHGRVYGGRCRGMYY